MPFARRPIPAQAVTVDALAGPDAGSSYILLPGTYELGRDDDADVRLTDPTVSRRHARITVDVGLDGHRSRRWPRRRTG